MININQIARVVFGLCIGAALMGAAWISRTPSVGAQQDMDTAIRLCGPTSPGTCEDALPYARDAIRKMGDNPRAWLVYSTVLRELDRDVEAAHALRTAAMFMNVYQREELFGKEE